MRKRWEIAQTNPESRPAKGVVGNDCQLFGGTPPDFDSPGRETLLNPLFSRIPARVRGLLDPAALRFTANLSGWVFL
ncbi:MAG TPA: hypothetical protein VLX28_18870 [Thermoanaerobaculia bacterium]|nr:hypothetical protein [Thermoanaerobaculia bacterium]